MSLSNACENALWLLLFNATTFANVAVNATSSPLTNLYVSLHTADPGEAGDQTTSETGYGGYGRVAVARTSGGWTVTNNSVTNAAEIAFPACTSGTSTVTHFGIGSASSGTGVLYISGALTASLAVSSGITPRFAAGALTATID